MSYDFDQQLVQLRGQRDFMVDVSLEDLKREKSVKRSMKLDVLLICVNSAFLALNIAVQFGGFNWMNTGAGFIAIAGIMMALGTRRLNKNTLKTIEFRRSYTAGMSEIVELAENVVNQLRGRE